MQLKRKLMQVNLCVNPFVQNKITLPIENAEEQSTIRMVELSEVKSLDTALKLASVMPLWNMATVPGLHLLLMK